MKRLTTQQKNLNEANEEVVNGLLDEEVDDEEIDRETAVIDEYTQKIEVTMIKLQRALKISDVSPPRSPSGSEYGTASGFSISRKTHQLPKIQIRKFNGEVLNWLGWWAQFEKIHLDKQLHDSDKFQYFVQSLESEAKTMVERYPQSAENYPLAIAALKDRFANPKLLRKVYIRELQKLVISNVKSKVKLGE